MVDRALGDVWSLAPKVGRASPRRLVWSLVGLGAKKIVLSIGRIEEVVLRRVGRYGVWFVVFDSKI